MDVLLTAESERFTNDPRPHGRMFVRDTINVSMYLSYEFAMNLFHWEVEILRVIYDIKELLMTSRYFGFYRPQCICGKVMFSQASVILFTGEECLTDTHKPLADTFLGRHIPGQTPPYPSRHPPRQTLPTPPPPGRHCPGNTHNLSRRLLLWTVHILLEYILVLHNAINIWVNQIGEFGLKIHYREFFINVLRDVKCEPTFTRLWWGFAHKECKIPGVL